MTTAIGTTQALKTGVATCSPSMALRILTAGVIIPSPRSSEAPMMPRATRIEEVADGSRAVSERIPPSPWLSALKTTAVYLIEMTRISAYRTSESTPSTFSCVGLTECEPKKHSRMA